MGILIIKRITFWLFIVFLINPSTMIYANKSEVFNLHTAPKLPTNAVMGFDNKPFFSENFDTNWIQQNLPKNSSWRIATWMQNGVLMKLENLSVERLNQEHTSEKHLSEEQNKDLNSQLIQKVVPFDKNMRSKILHSGGSVQTSIEFGYGRWLAKVKPSNVPGVLNSIFTKDWDDLQTVKTADGTKREIDIEFLTHTFRENSGQVHLAVHGSKADGGRIFVKDILLNFNPSNDYHIWGFDILPDKVIWHVDGKVLYTWYYPKPFYINEGYEFFLNSWTKNRWIKGPPKSAAEYSIDWVKFYPLNTKIMRF